MWKGPWYLTQLNLNSNAILAPEDFCDLAGYQYNVEDSGSFLRILCLGSRGISLSKIWNSSGLWELYLNTVLQSSVLEGPFSIPGSTQDHSQCLLTPPSDLALRRVAQTMGWHSHQSSLLAPQEGNCWGGSKIPYFCFSMTSLQCLEHSQKSINFWDIAFILSFLRRISHRTQRCSQITA